MLKQDSKHSRKPFQSYGLAVSYPSLALYAKGLVASLCVAIGGGNLLGCRA